ncbi:uncharacterized protein LOC123273899 [Cotesia glomerata]|uniref:uncharacterized protein LOC123273899 n=1 Tax=Cotesia glomerata TaxID=32391 RepID=UPI001D0132F1|nr:uncharacterized protein LOC123273899 [Cotesia glomerata]
MPRIINENGHSYIVEKVLHGRSDVHCRLRLRDRCPARGIKIGNNPITLTKNHYHSGVLRLNQMRLRFKAALTASVRQTFLPLHVVYDEVAARFADPVVASSPFETVQRLMASSRQRFVPDVVDNYVDLINTLNNQHYFRLREYYTNYSIELSALHDDALIMGDPRLIAEFAFETFYFTTTTSVLPQLGNTRLITNIVAQYHNNVFPVATILWSNMSEDIVAEVLNQLSAGYLVPNNIRYIFTDLYLSDCLKTAFPNAKVISTYDSFCRMIHQQAINHNVDFQNVDQKHFVMKTIGITLLPEDMMIDAFDDLVNTLSVPVRAALQGFINYLTNSFINGNLLVNFYNSPNAFNNASTLAKRDLQNRVGANPTAWDFMSN